MTKFYIHCKINTFYTTQFFCVEYPMQKVKRDNNKAESNKF